MTGDPDFFDLGPDYRQERISAVIEQGMVYLNACATVSPEGVAWLTYDWLQVHAAGMPYVALTETASREDARFWAETATPPELEAYAFAALLRLQGSPFAGRQIKRMVASLWRQMSPTEQTAFKEWIAK